MQLKEPTSMEECVYFTNRTPGKGRIRAWVFKEKCPKCKESIMGKPKNKKTGKVLIRSKTYVCSSCNFSMEDKTKGSLDQAADKICIGVSVVLKAQIITKGRSPRTRKTAKNIPQVRNQRLAFAPMVCRTSALMMALSTDETASKSERPTIVMRAENIINFI